MADIDLHDIRSSLKLIRDTGESTLFENRAGAKCPVCGSPFDDVLETTEDSRCFSPDVQIDFCIVNDESRLLLFTHV